LRSITSFAIVLLTALATGSIAESPRISDYSLRVHIVQNSNHTHYERRVIDYVDGEGRANLFENSQPRGFDYGFRCGDRVRLSDAYETFPARWKKPGRELEILQPVMGKPGDTWSCTLKVEMKDSVFVRHNGLVSAEPAAQLKGWMDIHQYDPEHGKNEPVGVAPATPPAPAATPSPTSEPNPQ
jgi:hypothetical protein